MRKELTADYCNMFDNNQYPVIPYKFDEVESTYYEVKTICQLFEEQVDRAPDNIAIESKNITYSYKTLNEAANQLARYIRTRYKALTGEELKANTLIPISVRRSTEYIIGILGILKSGAAYVPINPDYPASRIDFILKDINSKLILTESHLSEKFNNNDTNHQIFLDEGLFLEQDKNNINIQNYSNDLAYVIYTSGSTGTPKGVLAQHLNVVAQVKSANYFYADQSDTLTFFSDVSFDSTTFEIWGALLNGAKLFIPDDLFDLLSNPILFKEIVAKKNITIVLLTRALFDLLYTLDETVFAPLKFLLVGGEALTKNLMFKLLKSKYKPKNLINAYGPTENSTFCTTYKIDDDFSKLSSVPIGKPYSNRIAYVLDRYMQPLPIGAVGELFVGGPSLSKGYLNQPELTQERFISNPFIHESGGRHTRIYKTNDLAKWLPDGNLEYVGRNDFQVKLRGYRIELSEIETRLLEIPEVKHSVVLLKKNDNFSYLIGYYVSDNKLDDKFIRNYLTQILPEYMVPSVFVYLETLPVTTNGKLDRKALPEPNYQSDPKDFYSGAQSIEKTLYKIWAKILNIDNFGVDESFFNLGGNSLAAMMVRKEIEDAFKIKLNIVELFQHTTLKQLSERISVLKIPSESLNAKEFSQVDTESISQYAANEAIAIVGMSCRMPGVQDPESFWELLINEKSNIRDFPIDELRANQVSEALITSDAYVKRGAVLEDRFCFDASFFGYSVKDAEIMDPQQRQFLECAWKALEYSGNVPEKFNGLVGVFASQGRNYYFMDNIYSQRQEMSDTNIFQAILGNEKDFLSSRVSYKLNLKGPSITLQTACSSSLVSVQIACDSLRTHGCDMALAGGVSLFYNHGYAYQEEMIESPDGYCRAFDANAKGTVITSGVGVVVLKRLSDAIAQKDTIYAVIKGGAINNDGDSKMAFTAPSVSGQMAVIERAIKNAATTPETISYIEAHGTGTSLGDPIEWTALHNVYNKYVTQNDSCVIGAVKTNIGHTDSAAGVLGLIKTVLALKHKVIPATLNFETLNSEIASFNKLFKVNNQAINWDCKNKVRRAAVSSFGLGGTNAHIILEEYKDNETEIEHKFRVLPANQDDLSYYLIPFSAKVTESLSTIADKLKQHILSVESSEIHNVSYTVQEGRSEFNERGYFLISNSKNKDERLIKSYMREGNFQAEPKVNFILPELTADKIFLFCKLYKKYPTFKTNFDLCAKIIREKHGIDIDNLFIEKNIGDKICDDRSFKLISFSIQYALVQLLISSNIAPYRFIGYGYGLYVIAVAAGILSLENILTEFFSEKKMKEVILAAKMSEISNDQVEVFSHKKIRYPLYCAKNISNPDFYNQNSDLFKISNNDLFVEIADNIICDKKNTCCAYPKNREDAEIAYLKLIGWLWSNGLKISWDKINFTISSPRKVRIPTYSFVKKNYLIPSVETYSESSTEEQSLLHETLPLEIQLKEIWSNVLGVSTKEITNASHFFNLGGDSLAFIDLFNVIKKNLLPNINMEEIINYSEFGEIFSFVNSKLN